MAAWGLAALVGLYYALALHSVVENSDGASLVLQGASMAGGNTLLHGWTLSLDSFWTTEVPFYALGNALLGPSRILLALVPAVIAGLVVLVGAAIAGYGRNGRSRTAAVATVIALLAFPGFAQTVIYLRGGTHVGTVLLALVAFWGLRRNSLGWGLVLSTAAIIAGMLGDFLTLAYAVVPIFLAGLAAALRRRSVPAGAPALLASMGGVLLAFVLRGIAVAGGAFVLNPGHPLANSHQLLTNVEDLPAFVASTLGFGNSVYAGTAPSWLEHFRIVGALLVAVTLFVAMSRLVVGLQGSASTEPLVRHQSRQLRQSYGEEDWRLDDMLLFASFGPAATFLVLAFTFNPAYERYVVPSLLFASILCARMIGLAWQRWGRYGAGRLMSTAIAATALLGAAAVIAQFASPAPVASLPKLAATLVEQHLDHGVGDYWDASILTVESSGHAIVRPVSLDPRGKLSQYPHESSASWYVGKHFTFLVYKRPEGYGGVDSAAAVRTWGTPTRTESVGEFRILIWKSPFRVAPAKVG